jgi:hypothetical protein
MHSPDKSAWNPTALRRLNTLALVERNLSICARVLRVAGVLVEVSFLLAQNWRVEDVMMVIVMTGHLFVTKGTSAAQV